MDNLLVIILALILIAIAMLGWVCYNHEKNEEDLYLRVKHLEDQTFANPQHFGPIYDSAGNVVFEGNGPPPGYKSDVAQPGDKLGAEDFPPGQYDLMMEALNGKEVVTGEWDEAEQRMVRT